MWFQSGVCRSSAEDPGVDEQTETACEGHGDQLLQDAAGITYRLTLFTFRTFSLTACF